MIDAVTQDTAARSTPTNDWTTQLRAVLPVCSNNVCSNNSAVLVHGACHSRGYRGGGGGAKARERDLTVGYQSKGGIPAFHLQLGDRE